ncbi:MAG: type 1 glutamine amidotransferase domain-containing protein [Pseudomonadota bacterium]|nr:type 1 glutamine amidotransferase domain-containing protein [Pseudomonadota bacterium]
MAKVAFVLGEDFEDNEFRVPYDRLRDAGHEITLVGVKKNAFVEGKRGREKVGIGATPGEVRADDFDLLVIPGGYSPDHLRLDIGMVKFVREFGLQDRLIAAVCHGPSLLIEADLVDGRRLTSWPSIHADLVNAGAHWEDAPVVEDGNLITSRNPGDLAAFCDAILDRLAVTTGAPV